MAESLSEQVARHDCEEWHNEGIGCTHCHAVLYPAPPAPEVTEAMVEAAIAEFCSQTGDSYAMLMANASDEDKAVLASAFRHILTAALAARGNA